MRTKTYLLSSKSPSKLAKVTVSSLAYGALEKMSSQGIEGKVLN
jgi:hypothetical protein